VPVNTKTQYQYQYTYYYYYYQASRLKKSPGFYFIPGPLVLEEEGEINQYSKYKGEKEEVY